MGSNSGKSAVLGVLGAIVGLAITAASGGTGAALFSGLFKGLVIGYSVGTALFPPEVDKTQVEDEFSSPIIEEGKQIAIGAGTFRTFGTMISFDPKKIKKIRNHKYKDRGGDYTYAPLAYLLSMSEASEYDGKSLSEYDPSLYTFIQEDEFGNFIEDSVNFETNVVNLKPDPPYPNVQIFLPDGTPYRARPYLLYRLKGDAMSSLDSALRGISSWTELIAKLSDFRFGVQVQSVSVSTGKPQLTTVTRYVDIEPTLLAKSFPLCSFGGDPVDFSELFHDPNWHSGEFSGQYFSAVEPAAIGFPDDLPPMEGAVVVASPWWYLGIDAGSIPRYEFEVANANPSNPLDFYKLVLTNKRWGLGQDESILSLKTFASDGFPSSLIVDDEQLAFNGKLEGTTGKSALQSMNFHLNTILRRDHLGRLELMPVRSIEDHHGTEAEYQAWIDAGAPDTGSGGYEVGMPVLWEVKADEQFDIQISNQLWNSVGTHFTYAYRSKEHGFKTVPATSINELAFDLAGRRIDREGSFPLFGDANSAYVRMQQIQRASSRPNAVVNLKTGARFLQARIGDGIRVFSEPEDIQGTIYRIMKIKDAPMGSIGREFECVLDMDSLYRELSHNFYINPPPAGNSSNAADSPQDPQAIGLLPISYDSVFSRRDNSAPEYDPWPDNLGEPPGLFRYQQYVPIAKGRALSGQLQGTRYGILEGKLAPSPGEVAIPESAKGISIQPASKHSELFTLVNPLSSEDHTVSLSKEEGGAPVYLLHQTYDDRQDFLQEPGNPWPADKDFEQWDSDFRVLCFVGSTDIGGVGDRPGSLEIMRYKSMELVQPSLINLVDQPFDLTTWVVNNLTATFGFSDARGGNQATRLLDSTTAFADVRRGFAYKLNTRYMMSMDIKRQVFDNPETDWTQIEVYLSNVSTSTHSNYLRIRTTSNGLLEFDTVTQDGSGDGVVQISGYTEISDGWVRVYAAIDTADDIPGIDTGSPKNVVVRVIPNLTQVETNGTIDVSYVQLEEIGEGVTVPSGFVDDSKLKSGRLYKVHGLIRGSNREPAFSWPSGTEIWLSELGSSPNQAAPILPDGSSNLTAWPHRGSSIQRTNDASVAAGAYRVRAVAQSVFSAEDDNIQLPTWEQTPDEGILREFDTSHPVYMDDEKYYTNQASSFPALASKSYTDPLRNNGRGLFPITSPNNWLGEEITSQNIVTASIAPGVGADFFNQLNSWAMQTPNNYGDFNTFSLFGFIDINTRCVDPVTFDSGSQNVRIRRGTGGNNSEFYNHGLTLSFKNDADIGDFSWRTVMAVVAVDDGATAGQMGFGIVEDNVYNGSGVVTFSDTPTSIARAVYVTVDFSQSDGGNMPVTRRGAISALDSKAGAWKLNDRQDTYVVWASVRGSLIGDNEYWRCHYFSPVTSSTSIDTNCAISSPQVIRGKEPDAGNDSEGLEALARGNIIVQMQPQYRFGSYDQAIVAGAGETQTVAMSRTAATGALLPQSLDSDVRLLPQTSFFPNATVISNYQLLRHRITPYVLKADGTPETGSEAAKAGLTFAPTLTKLDSFLGRESADTRWQIDFNTGDYMWPTLYAYTIASGFDISSVPDSVEPHWNQIMMFASQEQDAQDVNGDDVKTATVPQVVYRIDNSSCDMTLVEPITGEGI